MASKRKVSENSDIPARPPAATLEGRENQLTALAVNLAEKQLVDGTISSQNLNHYLKIASTRDQLEKDKLKSENDLLKAKIEGLESASRIEALYEDALSAMREYGGSESSHDDIDD